MIGIFNRSYYEEVLIARVHPKILEAQNHSAIKLRHAEDAFGRIAYKSINDLESHLASQWNQDREDLSPSLERRAKEAIFKAD